MVKRTLLLLALLSIPLSTSSEESFVPENLQFASMIACGVGGNADATADAIVEVDYAHDRRAAFHALIARQSVPDPIRRVVSAIEDCREWLKRIEKALERGK